MYKNFCKVGNSGRWLTVTDIIVTSYGFEINFRNILFYPVDRILLILYHHCPIITLQVLSVLCLVIHLDKMCPIYFFILSTNLFHYCSLLLNLGLFPQEAPHKPHLQLAKYTQWSSWTFRLFFPHKRLLINLTNKLPDINSEVLEQTFFPKRLLINLTYN